MLEQHVEMDFIGAITLKQHSTVIELAVLLHSYTLSPPRASQAFPVFLNVTYLEEKHKMLVL